MAALLAGALAAGGCSSGPACPPGASCPSIMPRVVFAPAINGVSFSPRSDGHVPQIRVRAGEYLVMHVAVIVPAHVHLTALWFGISTHTWGNGAVTTALATLLRDSAKIQPGQVQFLMRGEAHAP